MATITKCSTIREAHRLAKEILLDQMDLDLPDDVKPSHIAAEFVLRPDGDTDVFELTDEGKIDQRKEAGWLTRGMCVSPSDTPCIVSV